MIYINEEQFAYFVKEAEKDGFKVEKGTMEPGTEVRIIKERGETPIGHQWKNGEIVTFIGMCLSNENLPIKPGVFVDKDGFLQILHPDSYKTV